MIRDLILKNHFKKFALSWKLGMDEGNESSLFEKFINYTLLCGGDPSTFTGKFSLLEACSVGGTHDTMLDGLGIRINGQLVASTEDIDRIADQSQKIAVEFILIQSKERPELDKKEFISFTHGIGNFFSEGYLPENDDIKHWRELKEYILGTDRICLKLEDTPKVKGYYAYCGKHTEDDYTIGLIQQLKTTLNSCTEIGEVDVEIVDGGALKSLCERLESTYSSTFNYIDIIPLTVNDNSDVKKAYAFTCEARELLHLICDSDGSLHRGLFNDNVRDYLGNRSGVNGEIEQTIAKEPSMFLMCNNGITIVCNDFVQIRDKYGRIDNPQIVNGCQTCSTIYNNRESNSMDRVQVLVKLICTDSSEVTSKIVRGTNKQNQVLDESFETTRQYHYQIEEYFNAVETGLQLHYERRNKQYSNDPAIEKCSIVNLRVLTQTFTALFLQMPHMAHRHESKLLAEFGKDDDRTIFSDSQPVEMYYTSAVLWYKVEEAFRNKTLSARMKPYRGLMYYLVSFMTGRYPANPKGTSRSIEIYCKSLLDCCLSPSFQDKCAELEKLFWRTLEMWEQSGKSTSAVKDNAQFTEFLKRTAIPVLLNSKAEPTEPAATQQPSNRRAGRILSVHHKSGHWFAFIKQGGDEPNVYFDRRSFSGDASKLRVGVPVRFILKMNADGRCAAEDVTIDGLENS